MAANSNKQEGLPITGREGLVSHAAQKCN